MNLLIELLVMGLGWGVTDELITLIILSVSEQ